MALVNSIGIDHVSYLLIIYSLAFLLFLFTHVLLHIFIANTPEPKNPDTEGANSIAGATADRRVADAEEFELEGLISDDEGSQVDKSQQ